MVKGRLINKAIGRIDIMPLQEAEKIAIDLLNGKSLFAATSSTKTLSDVIDDWLSSPRGIGFKQSYRDLILRYSRTKFPEFMGRPIGDIDKQEIRDWYRKGANAPTSTDGAFRVLHTAFEYAIALEMIEHNPCQTVSRTGRYKKSKRTGHIASNGGDIGRFAWALVQYAPPQRKRSHETARDAILLLLITGMRSDEVKSLKWSNVDFVKKQFTLIDTKNRRNHTIPMTRLMYAMFKSRYENIVNLGKTLKGNQASTYVFPNRVGSGHITDFRKTMAGLCEFAGINRITPHDLRRTFVTIGNELDIDYESIKRMVNHATDVTGDYMQVTPVSLRDKFERISNHISMSMPVSINGISYESGAGEPDNLLNLLYGDKSEVSFHPSATKDADYYNGL